MSRLSQDHPAHARWRGIDYDRWIFFPIKPVNADWLALKVSVEAVLDQLEERHRGSHPDDVLTVSYLNEIRGLGRTIERKLLQEAQVYTALFLINKRPNISPRVMADRIQAISAARLTVTYGYMVPQALNELYHQKPAYLPLKLWTTVEDYCRDYNPASIELNKIIDSIDPNVRPQLPGPGLCD